MNSYPATSRCKLNECFRSRFQQRLADYRAKHDSAAEGFGVIWEKTLEEVPVDEEAQGQLYRDLINWAKNGESLTTRNQRNNNVRITEADRMVRPRSYYQRCHCLIQESEAEIQHLHSLMCRRQVLAGRSHQLAEDLRNLYRTTEKLWFMSIHDTSIYKVRSSIEGRIRVVEEQLRYREGNSGCPAALFR